MKSRLAAVAIGLLLAITPALMAPSGGVPSRPRFAAIGINVAAPTEAGRFSQTGVEPTRVVIESDAAADNRRWSEQVSAESLTYSITNDANSAATEWLQVHRTGTTLDQVEIANVNILPSETTATASVTGCTTVPTPTTRFVRHGNLIVASIDTFSCTSNTTAMTITSAIPAGFQATRQQSVPIAITNNTAQNQGWARIDAGSGTIIFGAAPANTTGGGFTAAGNKGVPIGATFAYIVN